MLPMPDFNWVSRGGPPTGVCKKEWFRPDVDELEVCKKYMSPVNVSVEKVESRRKNIVLSFKSLQQHYENLVLFDSVPMVCKGGVCSTHNSDKEAIFHDDDHIGAKGLDMIKADLKALI